jgi:hypothetical protein
MSIDAKLHVSEKSHNIFYKPIKLYLV